MKNTPGTNHDHAGNFSACSYLHKQESCHAAIRCVVCFKCCNTNKIEDTRDERARRIHLHYCGPAEQNEGMTRRYEALEGLSVLPARPVILEESQAAWIDAGKSLRSLEQIDQLAVSRVADNGIQPVRYSHGKKCAVDCLSLRQAV